MPKKIKNVNLSKYGVINALTNDTPLDDFVYNFNTDE